jgi:hypothetical protein
VWGEGEEDSGRGNVGGAGRRVHGGGEASPAASAQNFGVCLVAASASGLDALNGKTQEKGRGDGLKKSTGRGRRRIYGGGDG